MAGTAVHDLLAPITKIDRFMPFRYLPRLKELQMNVSIGERWETFIDAIVKQGRYSSASEVVREGLRLVEEREAKLTALRETLAASIARGGENTEEDVDAALDALDAELAKAGY
jgi:antitoxin ParD1/3/4